MVSIGIPFKNPGRWLVDAVRSVFAQSWTDWELILVDDGSSDESVNLASKIADPRVRLIVDGHSKGLPSRLNEIIGLARGEYVARMDADDLMHPERIIRQIEILKTKPEVKGVFSGAYILNNEGSPLGIRKGITPAVIEVFSRGGYLHPTMLAHKEWLAQNLYSEDFPRAEDRELFVRSVVNGYRFEVLPEPLYFYRWVGNMKPRAMLLGYQSERRVMMRYGPMALGWPRTLNLLTRSLMKSAALWGLSLFNLENLVAKRSFVPMEEEQRLMAEEVLRRIKETKVPGWDF